MLLNQYGGGQPMIARWLGCDARIAIGLIGAMIRRLDGKKAPPQNIEPTAAELGIVAMLEEKRKAEQKDGP